MHGDMKLLDVGKLTAWSAAYLDPQICELVPCQPLQRKAHDIHEHE